MSEPLACPFCTAPLADAAIRCASCGQDVALVMPALRRLRALEADVQALRAEIRSAAIPATPPAPAADHGGRLLLCLAISFAALLLAHQLIVMRLDLPTILLRLASVAIPCCCVLLLRPRAGLGIQALAGVALGIAATLAMSAVVAHADAVPLIPRDARGVRELAEYAVSIALAHLAGAAFLHLRQAALLRRQHSPTGLLDRATTAQRMAEAAMPLAALAASVYGGLRALLD